MHERTRIHRSETHSETESTEAESEGLISESQAPPTFSLTASPIQRTESGDEDTPSGPLKDKGKQKSANGEYSPLKGTYVIAGGDNLTAIARRFSTTIAEIQKVNPQITDINQINEGGQLTVPGTVFGNDPTGAHSKTWSVEDYVEKREGETGEAMTDHQKSVLGAGCIGITADQLGIDYNPPLDRCYSSFEKALSVAQQLNAELAQNGEADLKKAIIFSKRFYSAGDDYAPDEDGQVDMAGYDHKQARPRPGGGTFTNFDYGYYDEQTGNWWHANHSEPGMKIYESTLEHYSRPLADFDEQVFCVAIQPAK